MAGPGLILSAGARVFDTSDVEIASAAHARLEMVTTNRLHDRPALCVAGVAAAGIVGEHLLYCLSGAILVGSAVTVCLQSGRGRRPRPPDRRASPSEFRRSTECLPPPSS